MNKSMRQTRNSLTTGFTLIELLIVVAIIAILAGIAAINFQHANERALKSSDAANLHTIATALQTYYVDYNDLPPADRQAGPFPSHGPTFAVVGDGPAGGGSWDGLPWLLYELGYIEIWETLFCPKFLKLYRGGKTISTDYERFHNFRYAYNSSALSSGGHLGGDGNVMSGTVWIVRDLWVAPQDGWFAERFPRYPADYRFPWGDGEWDNMLEHVIYADFAVKTVIGGTDDLPLP